MGNRGSASLLSLPIALAGCLAAHWLAYLVSEQDAHRRAELLADAGHGYLTHAPLLAAAGAAVVLAAAVRHALAAARGVSPETPSPWLFAVLPPLAFTLQEHLERLLHTRAWPLDAALEPTFLLGLLLQLPFALLALALARALVRVVEALAARVAPPRPRAPCSPPSPPAVAPPSARRALARQQRAPPRSLVLPS